MKRSILAIVSSSLLLVAAGQGNAATIGYYRFEGDLITSVGSDNGTVISGSPTYSGAVPINPIPQTGASNAQSGALGTSDAISFNYAFPFNGGNGTVEFWVKPNIAGVPATYGDHDIFWTTTAGGDANRFNILQVNNDIVIDYRDVSGDLQTIAGTAAGTVPDGVWTFVAIVKSGNTYSIYLNQAQTPSATATLTSPLALPTSTSWTLNGRYLAGNGTGQWQGAIDELRLSDVALSPSQFLVTDVPEPSSLGILAVGLGLLVRRSRA